MAHLVVSVLFFLVLLTNALAQQTTCRVVSRCSCSMSDGSGVIDLHRLDMAVFNVYASNTTGYSYEPCLKTLSTSRCNSSEAVLCRYVVVDGQLQHTTVATATGEYFSVSSDGSVTVVYNMTGSRSSSVYVQLVCNAGSSETVFKEIEQPTGQGSQSDLHFQLESGEACLFKEPSINHSTKATPTTDSTQTNHFTMAAPKTNSTTTAPTNHNTTATPKTNSTTATPKTNFTTAAPTNHNTTAASKTNSTTATPKTNFTTTAPTNHNTTATSKTNSTTAAPTNHSTMATSKTNSTTAAPKTNSTTAAPTTHSTTAAPTTRSTTAALTTHSTTAAPTTRSTTAAPTNHSTKATPTNHSTKAAPTNHSTKTTPTNHSTKATPTNHSTKATPTTQNTTNATSHTNLPSVTPNSQSSCSLSDCGWKLAVAVPVTAVGVSLAVILLSCSLFKWKSRREGRYTTL